MLRECGSKLVAQAAAMPGTSPLQGSGRSRHPCVARLRCVFDHRADAARHACLETLCALARAADEASAAVLTWRVLSPPHSGDVGAGLAARRAAPTPHHHLLRRAGRPAWRWRRPRRDYRVRLRRSPLHCTTGADVAPARAGSVRCVAAAACDVRCVLTRVCCAQAAALASAKHSWGALLACTIRAATCRLSAASSLRAQHPAVHQRAAASRVWRHGGRSDLHRCEPRPLRT